MILGLGGFATSGKDAVADLLVANHGWVKTYMSKPLERALLTLDPMVYVEDSFSYESYAELHGRLGYDESKKVTEVRRLLQVLGTEVGRNQFDVNLWTRLAGEEIDRLAADGSNVVVTGIRFANELDLAPSRGGYNAWVDRGLQAVNGHASDNTLQKVDFAVQVPNTCSLAELAETVTHLDAWMRGRSS